ncbi:cytochrome P450 [Microdochium trichocladiopsis]|uniref:Cytochrome P450 n=1 Tax=Microdochium trichocladiopsis TaxID=1682393 RepID=A0A9P8XT90_9PEZI|nr:cytochrome P450 [Microdochium trichocladiopsis]KAH7014166.1 cytochrome P450 [Microdochium trichocladiopsis]
MPPSSLDDPLARVAAFAVGVASHLSLFRFGEWHLSTVKLVLSFTAVQAATITLLPRAEQPLGTNGSHFAAARVSVTLGALWIAGVFVSMLIYRGFFHRLCRFPGPFMARFSNFYVTGLSAKRLRLYKEVQQLHRQYGDIVRLGPQELSINNAEVFAAVSAPNSPCTKSDWYDLMRPMVALQHVRNHAEHAARRKVWDRGFSAKDYEPRVTNYTSQLLGKIARSEGKPLNVSDWFNFYSFDVMGDLAWGKSFGMLRDGIKHYFMKSLHADMTSVGIFTHLVWLFPIFKATPILNATHLEFWGWVNSQMKPEKADVFSWLLEDYESKPRTKQEEIDLTGDAYLIAVAGSDTTAASLTCLFFLLATNPKVLKALQKEIDHAYESTANSTPDSLALGKLTYLNAVINETIRLHPPVPSGLARETPAEGLTVGDLYIPGNTIVQVPSHTIFHNERYWGRPNDFIPERWTDQPELIKDGSVYAPFGFGRYSCIGKQLGLMEIRYVTAELVRRYDVKLAPGQTADGFIEGKRDTFTLALGKLDLVFNKRSA